MSNLYYEQLEQECAPNLLHLHLTKFEVQMLRFAIMHIPALNGLPTRDKLNRVFEDFLSINPELDIVEIDERKV